MLEFGGDSASSSTVKSSIDLAISTVLEWRMKYIPQIIRVIYVSRGDTTGSTDDLLLPTEAASSAVVTIGNMFYTKNLLWPHTWIDDMSTNRAPMLMLEVIHASSSSSSWYGLYGVNLLLWIEMIVTEIMVCLFISLPIAILMYYIIIVPQQPQSHQVGGTSVRNKSNRSTGSTSSPTKPIRRTNIYGYIFGWGVLLPLWIILPSPIATACGIDNIILRFCLCGINPTIGIFRTLEAMYGFAPSHTIPSVYEYALYFSSPLLLLLYPCTTDKSTTEDRKHHRRSVWFTSIRRQLMLFIKGLCMNGMYQSLLQHIYPYGTGPTSTPSNLYHWSSLWDVQLWYESLAYAILMQSYLSMFIAGLSMVTTLLTGYTTQPFSDAPLQSCTSPSDFWGRRWNLLIHTCLKNGVYKPIRSLGGSAVLAVVMAFVASGLFHEWLLPSTMPNYPHTHGLAMVFFVWQAMLIAMEMMIGTRFNIIRRYIPRPFITVMVVSLGLPVGHWFIDSYIRSDFFKHGQFGLPMILSIPVPDDTMNSISPLFQLYL